MASNNYIQGIFTCSKALGEQLEMLQRRQAGFACTDIQKSAKQHLDVRSRDCLLMTQVFNATHCLHQCKHHNRIDLSKCRGTSSAEKQAWQKQRSNSDQGGDPPRAAHAAKEKAKRSGN